MYRPVATTDELAPDCQLPSDVILIAVDGGNENPDGAKTQLQDGKYHRKKEPVKLKFLNGLRGLACLLVVHHHAGYLPESTLAPSSVDAFFVLSAFLLTMLNEPKVYQAISRNESPRRWLVTLVDYFVKRMLRVYPLFACVALALTLMPEATRNRYYNLEKYDIKQWSLWDVLAFKKRYYLFWTLPLEISYYFIIPVFLVGVCLLGKLKWLVVALLYVWVYYDGGHTMRTKHDAFRPQLSVFVAGSLAAVVYSKLSRWMKKRPFEPEMRHLAAVRSFEWVMLAYIVSVISRGVFAESFVGYLFPSWHPTTPSISLPLSAVIVIEALLPSSIARALEWNVLCYTGKISFSMYLLHPFVNFSPWLLELPRIDQFTARLVLVYALSTASYLVIERGFQRLAVLIGKQLLKSSEPAVERTAISW
ncbi:hypothetical protein PRIC1_014117 [Phytophthora ramorum]|uniref:uncharacterized protein n=1 Tax=Phytophthora ramorum TaxID=164328 RepID=UPI00309D904A|nr:hypothetical protein KRP23_151 [Phytophthora ramorum]KAH7499645.1 hypothetical protein KRP22_10262 [Phytophthora ramorum]